MRHSKIKGPRPLRVNDTHSRCPHDFRLAPDFRHVATPLERAKGQADIKRLIYIKKNWVACDSYEDRGV